MAKAIEVFCDMALRVPVESRPEVRKALIAAATIPWSADLERSADAARLGRYKDIVLFRRAQSEELPEAGVTLLEDPNGYHVPNIVPIHYGSLSYNQYNAILSDFVIRVVRPVCVKFNLTFDVSKPVQSLEDWIPTESAAALKQFSVAANKSSGASHPKDEERWFAFLIADYKADRHLGAYRLARWLNEIEGWDSDTAQNLAGDYEKASGLLAYYDRF